MIWQLLAAYIVLQLVAWFIITVEIMQYIAFIPLCALAYFGTRAIILKLGIIKEYHHRL